MLVIPGGGGGRSDGVWRGVTFFLHPDPVATIHNGMESPSSNDGRFPPQLNHSPSVTDSYCEQGRGG